MVADRPTSMELLERVCASPARGRAPRTLVVCAHPDDETIGVGARLAALADVAVACVTDGAPADASAARALGFRGRDEYRHGRRRERADALALAGVDASRIVELGVVDQRASLVLESLTRRLEALFERRRPEVVLTHPYEGGHPDHDATAFAVHAAVARLRAAGQHAPSVVEMTSYHARGADLVVGEFLDDAIDGGGNAVYTVELDATQRALKRGMLDRYASQRRVLDRFPVRRERFRVAPRYDFTRPPHAGRLWYEWFGWGGMTGARWRALAAEALARLVPAGSAA